MIMLHLTSTAVRKGSLSTARMNMTDGDKQPILTQMDGLKHLIWPQTQ